MSFKSISYIVLLLFSFSLVQCDNRWEELNTDPNNPVDVSPEYILPYAIEVVCDRYWGAENRYERLNLDGGMLWMKYLARNSYIDEGDNYNVTSNLYNNTWRSFYSDALVNFDRILRETDKGGRHENANFFGVALVMRSWVFSVLTEIYGAIPYTDALKTNGENPVFKPTYDSQEKVYLGVLQELKTANNLLDVEGQTVHGDILFNGDVLKWKKFTNSLRLKLANRVAARKPELASSIFAEIMGDPAKYPIIAATEDNVQLNHSSKPPSYNTWFKIMDKDNRTDWNMSEVLVERLKKLNDTRLFVFAEPITDTDEYSGMPNALPEGDALTYINITSTLGAVFKQETSPSVIMTYSELLFVLAEAALDGEYAKGSKAQEYFEQAVKASFDQYGLAVPEGYIENVGEVTKEKLMIQKWIALFGQGIESWTEYRRTGLPEIPAPDNRAILHNDGLVPTRLPYPVLEYSLNLSNVENGVEMNGGKDDMKTKLWFSEK